MSFSHSLRQLVDCQQFSQLLQHGQDYFADTHDIQILPLLALAHAHLGARKEAEAQLKLIEPRIAELALDARVDLAAVYCVLHRLDDALTLLEADYPIGTEHALLLARLAWCRMQQAKLSEARILYQQSAAFAPQRLPVWCALVNLIIQEGDFAVAQQTLTAGIKTFECLLTQFPEQVIQQFTLQFRHLQLQIWVHTLVFNEAEQWLNNRQKDCPEEEWIQLILEYSRLLAGQNQHSQAEDTLRNALKQTPTNILLYSELAELSLMQGRTQQTVQLLRRTIKLADNQEMPSIGLWVRLAQACLHNLPEQAKKAADKAAELADKLDVDSDMSAMQVRQFKWQATNALAQVASQGQDFVLAEDLFNQVLRDNPYFLPALQGLGQQQMQRGNIDQAVALFEQIKQIDPAKGYSSLINARQFPEDEETLKRIEKAARQPSMEGSVRASLLLQLAVAREKTKDYDEAYTLASEANNASKQLLTYDPQQHRQQCARNRFAFGKALFEHRKGYGLATSVPVFVVGMPRSGTTLVEQILASHSDIFGAGELGIIPSRIQGLNRWERHVGSGRQYPDCVDDLTLDVTQGIAKGMLNELQELAADDKPKAKHIVDKLPHNFENIGMIKFFFPQARIISVRRDPRDIALSNYFTDYQAKHGGMGFAYDMTWIGEQLADHNLYMHHWDQVFSDEILTVNYEDVVADTEGAARRMLAYIGVPWQSEVLAFNEHERAVKTASVWQVRQPIYATSTAKWRRYQTHLAPLIKGTNAKINPDPITDMLSLPQAGFLTDGVALFKENDLDGAELHFKKMLHHNPEHAACQYMLGLVYCRKGHVNEALPLFEHALDVCPWKKDWRVSLVKAYEEMGMYDKAQKLGTKGD
ncbi:MAG: sulfotransferase [Paraglaciecola sp.]|uniref:sulfotransferase n=2 Tax=Paraglaciecola sp. TaxID=1920173 RepID=UPI00326695D5